MLILLVCILLILIIVTHGLRLAFHSSSPAELKRQARAGAASAHLYEVSRSSEGVSLILSILVALWGTLFIWTLFRITPWLFALPISIGILLFVFSVKQRWAQRVGRSLAPLVSSSLLIMERALHPLFKVLRVGKAAPVKHSGLYEKQDLVDLVQTQALQADNRISESELRVVWGALTYGDKRVIEVMVPRGQIDAVAEDDAIGPVLLDELHKSGHSRFPVLSGDPEEEKVSGILYLHDLLGVKAGGKVAAHMDTKVYYVHEDFTLDTVLRAFYKTKRQLFMVVNEFEDVVGLITLEDILAEILGRDMPEEFEEYESPQAVARMHKKSHKPTKQDEDAIIIDETVVESEQP